MDPVKPDLKTPDLKGRTKSRGDSRKTGLGSNQKPAKNLDCLNELP
jgi:hypothetical protein